MNNIKRFSLIALLTIFISFLALNFTNAEEIKIRTDMDKQGNPVLTPIFPTQNQSDNGSRLGGETPASAKDYRGIVSIPNPLKTRTFSELIDRIANWLLIIGAPILALLIIVGAFQIMTSGGSPDKVTTGRKTITYAIVGYALLLLSKSVTLIINDVLGVK